MSRKSRNLTPRERQSQQIMRQKAARKRRKETIHKLCMTVCFIAVGALPAGVFWVWKTQALPHVFESIADAAYRLTVRNGFALRDVYLEGRNRTAISDIDNALGVKKGDPLLRVSLNDIRNRLEQIESIRFASVERELPGTLIVRIVEREPVALWQHEGKVALVDDNGVVMKGMNVAPYRHLPLIVGSDAPAHVGEMLSILAAAPDLVKRFSAAIWVGQRRWNIRLQDGMQVKLPEDNAVAAWKTLAELQAQQKLLDRDVKVIDLRIEGRLFITLLPEEMPGKVVDAKET